MRWLSLPLALGGGIVFAQEDHAHHTVPPPDDAQIVVTINPEARVSAVLGASLPSPSACGDATELKVKIINQGKITAPLRARLVDGGARIGALHMNAEKLSGQPEDSRLLHLMKLGPGPVDMTVAFSIDNNIGDLGGRDRVHLLVRCGSL